MVSNGVAPSGVLHPPVSWAQRKNLVFLTVNIEDIKQPELKIEDNKVYFKATRKTDGQVFEADMTLYGEVNHETSKQLLSERNLQLMLMKKQDDTPFWPRLLKDSVKQHWLKVDFDKWRDEEDSDDENGMAGEGGMDMDAMMRQMGGLSGLGGAGDKPGMDDLGDMEDDSDDEDLPDLEDE